MRRLPRARTLLIAVGALCLAALATYLYRRSLIPSCGTMREWLQSWGILGPLAYLVVAILASMVFIPRSFGVVLAGLLFGFVPACVLVLIASLGSALLSFLITRYFARDWVTRMLERHGGAGKLLVFVEKSELHFVMIVRLVHVLHYSMVNYALGLFNISIRGLLLGTFIGLIPGTITLVYAGHTAGCALVEPTGHVSAELKMQMVVVGTALSLLAIVPAWLAYRKHKRDTLP